jgi:hypothetical protein
MEPPSGVRRSRTIHLVLAAALALGACTSDATTSPSAPPPSLSGLSVKQPPWRGDPATWFVTLTWEPPAPPFIVDHVEIVRDGHTIGTTAEGSSFDDSGVLPNTRYDYVVVAVDARGSRTPPATASIKTHPPAVADARLSGRFVTKMRVTSTTVGQSGLRADWFFRPVCGSGPCRTRLAVAGRGLLGIITRSGPRYSGTLSAPFLILTCRHTHIDETLVVSIRITRARAFGRDWAATAFSGSFTETASAAGCVSGHNAYATRGRLVGQPS